MDIALARTFLMVAETGSFIDAARKMNITQSTVSARIKALEELFGRPLFERSKNGAALTGAGEQFQKHALALVRVWQHAQLEVGLSGPLPRPSGGRRARDAVGRLPAASGSSWLRDNIPDIAISAIRQPVGGDDPAPAGGHARSRHHVPARPAAGAHHRAPVRRGVRAGHQRAGAQPAPSEQLRVRRLGPGFPGRARRRLSPSSTNTGVNLDLGSLGLDFLLANEASGYFPRRLVKRHVNRRACASRRGRAPSPTRSTWSIPRRATRRPTSRSSTGLRRAAERLI